MPLISVIIPVYNAAPYLPESLGSVFAQTFTDLEVICVNVSSTDNSAEVLAEYKNKYPQLTVLDVENLGPGIGRNKGLDAARGKYIFFLDADDFLKPELLQRLYDKAQEKDYDLVITDFFDFDDKTKQLRTRRAELILPFKRELSESDGPDEFAKMSFSYPFVWGKLMKRELIESVHLRFPSGAAEDIPFSVSYGVLCKRAVFLEGERLMYYRVNRAGSISSRNHRMVLEGVQNFKVLEDFLKQQGLFEAVKETFWFNKMNLLIGDEKLWVGRLGNVPKDIVKEVYTLIAPDLEQLDVTLFKDRNWVFRSKVKGLKWAVKNQYCWYPKFIRKMRNVLMPFAEVWMKIKR